MMVLKNCASTSKPSLCMTPLGVSNKGQQTAQFEGPQRISGQAITDVDIDFREVYFLIAHFLSTGPCHKTMVQFWAELMEHQLLPRRYHAWYSRRGLKNEEENDDGLSFPLSYEKLIHRLIRAPFGLQSGRAITEEPGELSCKMVVLFGPFENQCFLVSIVNDRLPTLENLRKRNISVGFTDCSICENHLESGRRVLLVCQVASSIWSEVFSWWKTPAMRSNQCSDLYFLVLLRFSVRRLSLQNFGRQFSQSPRGISGVGGTREYLKK